MAETPTLQERLSAYGTFEYKHGNLDRARLLRETTDRIDQLGRELAEAKASETAIRELMNVYNLGGWTDAEAPMKRALAAEKSLAAMQERCAKVCDKQAALHQEQLDKGDPSPPIRCAIEACKLACEFLAAAIRALPESKEPGR